MHPVIAVDAVEGALLGLVDAQFFVREGGKRGQCREKPFLEKESRRWLDGMVRAGDLAQAGAACVTVVADREGDIYEDFALRPAGVEVLAHRLFEAGVVAIISHRLWRAASPASATASWKTVVSSS